MLNTTTIEEFLTLTADTPAEQRRNTEANLATITATNLCTVALLLHRIDPASDGLSPRECQDVAMLVSELATLAAAAYLVPTMTPAQNTEAYRRLQEDAA